VLAHRLVFADPEHRAELHLRRGEPPAQRIAGAGPRGDRLRGAEAQPSDRRPGVWDAAPADELAVVPAAQPALGGLDLSAHRHGTNYRSAVPVPAVHALAASVPLPRAAPS